MGWVERDGTHHLNHQINDINDDYLDIMTDQSSSTEFAMIPDVRDGLTRKERIVLYCLDQLQKELNGRNVPTVMLYGRVVEHVNLSEHELQAILQRFTSFNENPAG